MLSALLANTISFPGLGIGKFELNPEAFRLPLPWAEGGHPIMWYGIIIALAMVVGFTVALRKAKWEGIKSDTLFDLAIYLIIFAILGARLYYVIMEPHQFNSFWDVIAIWNGGLGIYGGIIAGAITILIFSKIKKINAAKILDIAAPGVIIGQAIGRWGNFFNAEAYGSVTSLPWRMCSDKFISELQRKGLIDGTQIAGLESGALGVHPTFLYECLWNLLGFVLINVFYKKKKYNGQIVLFYAVWYGFGRFFIEGLRTDSLYLLESVFGKTVRVSQLVAAICVVGGIIAMLILGKKAKYSSLENEAYDSVYTHDENNMANESSFEIKNKISENIESDEQNIKNQKEDSEEKEIQNGEDN